MEGDLARALGGALKNKQRLVGSVERYLLSVGDQSGRRTDCIHPSELSHESWCPRATYYRIMGVKPSDDGQLKKLSTEVVFETGHEAHRKWQSWFWEMGILRGLWYCKICRKMWHGISPEHCPEKGHGKEFIEYREVPASSAQYLLGGHADGDVRRERKIWRPIEIKTVGIGTVRHEAPKLVERFSYTYVDENDEERSYVDWPALWAGIRRPFSSHLKQGMLYLLCLKREAIIYLYEPKFVTGVPKEFEIEFQSELIEDLLDQCLLVKRSVERARPPKRPLWAEYESPVCDKCVYKTHCWGARSRNDDDASQSRHYRETSAAEGRGEAADPEGRIAPSRKARVRFAETPYESDGHLGRQAHATDGEARKVSRLRSGWSS